MVIRVLENVSGAKLVSRVVVATDDERIASLVRAAGGEVAMTPSDLESGTDRVWAAVSQIPCDIVINVQGDEPLVPGHVLDALVEKLLAEPEADIATPVVACPRGAAEIDDIVTVAAGVSGRALYFSRAVVPWAADPVWKHVGIYGYRRDALRRFVSAPPAALERVERLEQLRALSLGLQIHIVPVEVRCHAVDRPEDIAVVERLLGSPTAAGGQFRTPSDRPTIRLLVLDVDGVLTDGSITYEGDSDQVLTFNVKDGHGLVGLLQAGVEVGLVSARDSRALRRRAEELGIRHVSAGVTDKRAEVEALARRVGVRLEEVCYIGDDEPDLAAMGIVGLSAAPADARPSVRARVDLLLGAPGGRGAVRELADWIVARLPSPA